jgi:membrane protein implicated in regulation of membrane protease activity
VEETVERAALLAAAIQVVILLAGAALVLLAAGVGQLVADLSSARPGTAWLVAGLVLLLSVSALVLGARRALHRRRTRELARRLELRGTARRQRTAASDIARQEADKLTADELLDRELDASRNELDAALGAATSSALQALDPRAWVKRRPLTSLGAAATLGLAGGLFAGPRRDESDNGAASAASSARSPRNDSLAWASLLLPLVQTWLANREERPLDGE